MVVSSYVYGSVIHIIYLITFISCLQDLFSTYYNTAECLSKIEFVLSVKSERNKVNRLLFSIFPSSY